jgi:crossover junction endodeoxyribonuclease RuvC
VTEPGIIGCDPGLDGALVLLSGGAYLGGIDMPTVTRDSTHTKLTFDKETGLPQTRKVKGKRDIDLDTLCRYIREWRDLCWPLRLYIEDVGPMPQQGVVSVFKFGFGTGELHGAAAMAKIPIFKVSPQRWKADMGVKAEKATSVVMAQSLEPDMAAMLKKDGRAEAFLIGRWGWMQWQKEKK